MSILDTTSGPQDLISREAFLEQLGQLAEKWEGARENDLHVRLQTGALLNARYGTPDKRQKRGERVLKEASEQLRLPESELSRLRWFAFHFSSLEDLKQKHSTVTTWAAMKELLPTLRPKAKAKRKHQSGAAASKLKGKAPGKLRKIKQQLDGLPSEVRQIHQDLTDEEKQDLLERLYVAAEALKQCFKVSGSVKVSEEVAILPKADCDESAEVETPLTVRLGGPGFGLEKAIRAFRVTPEEVTTPLPAHEDFPESNQPV